MKVKYLGSLFYFICIYTTFMSVPLWFLLAHCYIYAAFYMGAIFVFWYSGVGVGAGPGIVHFFENMKRMGTEFHHIHYGTG